MVFTHDLGRAIALVDAAPRSPNSGGSEVGRARWFPPIRPVERIAPTWEENDMLDQLAAVPPAWGVRGGHDAPAD